MHFYSSTVPWAVAPHCLGKGEQYTPQLPSTCHPGCESLRHTLDDGVSRTAVEVA